MDLLGHRIAAVTGVLDHLRLRSWYLGVHASPRSTWPCAGSGGGDGQTLELAVRHGRDELVRRCGRSCCSERPRGHAVVTMLERIDDVVESESLVVIRKFSAFEEWDPGTLAGGAVDSLRSGRAVADSAHCNWVEPERLTEQELEIVKVLALDGRATYATVAARTGISDSTAPRRVESLVSRGCLRFRTDGPRRHDAQTVAWMRSTRRWLASTWSS